MPNDAEAIAQADSLADQGRWEESAAIYRRLLHADADLPGVRHNLATVLLQLGQIDEAIEHCRVAISQRPDYSLALNTLGVALSRAGRQPEAIDALQAALRANPVYAKAAFNLGQALDQNGRRGEAIAAFHAALALDPRLEAAAFELAALGQLPAPAQMPLAYVSNLFDTYASRFDEHLAELNYVVPAMLLDCVRAVYPSSFGSAIDLGCGTGLVAAAFRPYVEHLTGVDLSPAMIAAAGRRGVYDELMQAEVVDYLTSVRSPCDRQPDIAFASACPTTTLSAGSGGVDLLLAADLLIYLGDLEPLFAAAVARLNRQGIFAFSIELVTGCDFVLQPTRRYAHATSYIRRLAAEHQLAEIVCREGNLRKQDQGDVFGAVFVLVRP